jgi:glycerol-3-phosphate dehydrogenase subunit B
MARLLKPRLKGVQALGLPAVLGLYSADKVFDDLNRRLGIPLFEIPTMPPSAVGLRLKEALVKALAESGVRLFSEQRVLRAIQESGGGFILTVASESQRHRIQSRAVILAGGRFLGGGLRAERKRICEPLFDLPVHQVPERASWHRQTFLDAKGHPINRAGLETDAFFRPLRQNGTPAHPALFAAGSILAHQDWMREKCGAGLAVSTAWGAVNACRRLMGGNTPALRR